MVGDSHVIQSAEVVWTIRITALSVLILPVSLTSTQECPKAHTPQQAWSLKIAQFRNLFALLLHAPDCVRQHLSYGGFCVEPIAKYALFRLKFATVVNMGIRH